MTENSLYDDLNRLTSSTIIQAGTGGWTSTVTVQYDTTGLGNIGYKSDVGTYIADSIKAMAFTVASFHVWSGVGGILHSIESALNAGSLIVSSAVHGVVSGALSLAQGGSFVTGFASGAIGQAAGMFEDADGSPLNGLPGMEGRVFRSLFAGAAGGAASELTGGKFVNGFVTAAFAHAWNQEGGVWPNTQHDLGVQQAIAEEREQGYEIAIPRAAAVEVPGFPTPRVYDFIIKDPVTNNYIGIEVKTTLFDTIRLNAAQVAKDVVVTVLGGTNPRVPGGTVKGVGYVATCFGCTYLDFRSSALATALRNAQIPYIRCDRPGDCAHSF